MKSFRFDLRSGAILAHVGIQGPKGKGRFVFAVDTGASRSLISWQSAILLGYSPEQASGRTEIVTGSSVEFCPEITVPSVEALGWARGDFPLLCHTLPPKLDLQGLLGLDFLAGRVLTVDFRQGTIRLG